MGEELGETAPFLYFIDHGDPALIEAVRQGRRAEFASFAWQEEIPDPQDPVTCQRSHIQVNDQSDACRIAMLRWTRTLIELRKAIPALGASEDRSQCRARIYEQEQVLVVHRRGDSGPNAMVVLGFNSAPASVVLQDPIGRWSLRLASTGTEFDGDGKEHLPGELNILPEGVVAPLPAYAVAVYVRAV
jgi:maltooligosyltrehalose trehalohydrolase